jgi:hypothetical protein
MAAGAVDCRVALPFVPPARVGDRCAGLVAFVSAARVRLDLVCAAAAVWGKLGSNDCPDSSSRITDDAVCRSAAAAVAQAYRGSGTWSASPSGCFSVGGTVHLNVDADGAPDAYSQLLCSGAASLRASTSSRGWGVGPKDQSRHCRLLLAAVLGGTALQRTRATPARTHARTLQI